MTASALSEGLISPPDTPSPPPDRPADRLILLGALSTGFGFVVRLGAKFLFLVVAGRLFGASLFGAYSLAVAVLEASVGFAGLSLRKTLFQFLDREGASVRTAPHILIDAILLVLAASAALAALIMTATALLPRTILAESTAQSLFWIAPMIAGQAIADILFAATRWRHAIRYEVVGRSIVEPYALLAGTVAAYGLGFHATGLVIGYWVGNIAMIAYALMAIRRSFPDFTVRGYHLGRLRPMARALLPNTWNELLGAIFSRMDLYLVGIFLGERWAGIYGMAQQVRTPLRQVRQSFDGLLIPMVSKTLTARGAQATVDALGSAARLILSIQMAFLLAIVVLGVQILELFGRGFGAGYLALIILTVAEAVQGTLGLGDLLFAYLWPRTGLIITAITFFISLGAAAVLIPRLGIGGAAAAMLIASTVQAVLRSAALRHRLIVRPPILPLIPPLIATLAGLSIAIFGAGHGLDVVSGWSLLATLGLYVVVLMACLRVSGKTLAITGFATSA